MQSLSTPCWSIGHLEAETNKQWARVSDQGTVFHHAYANCDNLPEEFRNVAAEKQALEQVLWLAVEQELWPAVEQVLWPAVEQELWVEQVV